MSTQRQATLDQTAAPAVQAPANQNFQAGQGNAFLMAQLQEQGQIPIPRPRPRPQTPRQIFEQRFDAQASREIDPAEERWKQLSEEEVAALALVPEEERAAAGQAGYSAAVNGQTWQWDAHAQDPETPLRASDMMGADATQVFSRAFETDNPDHADRTDVTVLNADGTTTVQPGNEHGMAELPQSGHGFRTHNRNDVRMNGVRQPDQYGSPESVVRTMNIMSDYATMFPSSSISIGDLSTDTGNSPRLFNNRNTRHASHYDGTQVDLQYADGVGSTNSASREDDDLFRQRSFMRTAEDWGMDNFHASPRLNGHLFPQEGTDVHYSQPHANHLHMGRGTGRH